MKSVDPEPGAPIDAGVKLDVTPDGTPEAENVMAALNPPDTFVVTTAYPLCPLSRYPEVGETEMVKEPVDVPVTVSDTVVVFVIPPPVPDTVIE